MPERSYGGLAMSVFQLTTMELGVHITEVLTPIYSLLDLGRFYFSSETRGAEGFYIFSDEKGYHMVYSERGCESTHKITDNLFEITFWVADALIGNIAFRSLGKDSDEMADQRKFLFEQELKLFEKLGPNYKKAAEIRIDEILKEYPYEE